ncbi:helix-hairpin-helix domain-containing protein [Mariprofundus sp. NF]|uniref:ComEA family DNA-binding protein n=1 Tax=Mariprofundus sp. NF TaxID=2608716 RepID=UPI0015A44057|nr:helix-hairpin-helix domain-containing protein [Mariprofundus sp. NF]NWF39309.1 helix-hairpin-helix domain-containing protein [Mariprofundus sp. NF]
MKIKHLLLSLFVALFMIAGPVTAGDRINLNTATIEQLQALPGIGPSTAAAIEAYRSEHGSFKSVDELTNVKGVGEKRLDAIRDAIEVSSK